LRRVLRGLNAGRPASRVVDLSAVLPVYLSLIISFIGVPQSLAFAARAKIATLNFPSVLLPKESLTMKVGFISPAAPPV
jgi:hypothetical protein